MRARDRKIVGRHVVLPLSVIALVAGLNVPPSAAHPVAADPPGSSWDHWRPSGRLGDDGETAPGGRADPADPAVTPGPPERRVEVVLSPHPDDETLSLGVWIADAVARGDRVVVVALTDGRSTGAIRTASARLGRPLTRDEIAAARLRELHSAAAALGVAPADVHAAGCDAEGSPGGSRVTVDEVTAVIDEYAALFPEATFATMSPVAERHPDHLAAGQALLRAARAGVVRESTFAVSRLWWSLPSPPTTDVVPSSPAVRERVRHAAAAYALWDPAHLRYSVGVLSVHGQFTALLDDPRTRLHPLP